MWLRFRYHTEWRSISCGCFEATSNLDKTVYSLPKPRSCFQRIAVLYVCSEHFFDNDNDIYPYTVSHKCICICNSKVISDCKLCRHAVLYRASIISCRNTHSLWQYPQKNILILVNSPRSCNLQTSSMHPPPPHLPPPSTPPFNVS